jgi:hypothetical protein
MLGCETPVAALAEVAEFSLHQPYRFLRHDQTLVGFGAERVYCFW